MEDLILINEYCKSSSIEIDFILLLEDEGLIKTEVHNEQKYLQSSQLSDIEMFRRLHYDLAINIEGIDVINNLLKRMRTMEQELMILRRQFDTDFFTVHDFFDEYE